MAQSSLSPWISLSRYSKANSTTPALDRLDPELQAEYQKVLGGARDEIAVVEGTQTVRSILLERFAFVYVACRAIETDWENVDLQRYNQLLGLWLKIGSDLLASYRDLFSKSQVERLFAQKVLTIITEEVTDHEVLARIRTRFANLDDA